MTKSGSTDDTSEITHLFGDFIKLFGGNLNITSNASHCIEIRIYGILELGPLLERLKGIVIGMVLSPTDELWHGFESWLTTMVIGKGGDLKILRLIYSLQVQ